MNKKNLVLLPVLLMVMTGCGNGNTDSDKLKVSTTFGPVFDFVTRIFGDKADIITLVGANEPHEFQPNDPKDAAFTERADFVFGYGVGMDDYVKNMCSSAQYHEITKDVPFEKNKDGVLDPHAWLSFDEAKIMLKNILDVAKTGDAANAEYYQTNYEKAVAEFDAEKAEYQVKLSKVSQHNLVTSHEAFYYLAKEFDLVQYGIGDIADTEPTASRFSDVMRFIKDNQIKTVFLEELDEPGFVKTVKDELSKQGYEIEYSELSAYESTTKDRYAKGNDYLSVMKENLNTLIEKL